MRPSAGPPFFASNLKLAASEPPENWPERVAVVVPAGVPEPLAIVNIPVRPVLKAVTLAAAVAAVSMVKLIVLEATS